MAAGTFMGSNRPGPSSVSASVGISASPETVWRTLVTPNLAVQWFNTMRRFVWTSVYQGGLDSTFSWEESIRGQPRSLDFVTTEWEPGELFGYKTVGGDLAGAYRARWQITSTTGGCRFSSEKGIVFPFFPWGISGVVVSREMRAELKESLRRLKSLAEVITDNLASRFTI